VDRRAEIAANLAGVRSQIAAASVAAGRDPAEVSLIAVTKFFPATDAALLLELGVTDLGESRDQEAAAKVAEVADLTGTQVLETTPRWHFIGRLQTNKARSVARYCAVVHSVDRPALVDALAAGVATRPERGRLRVLLQVSLDGDTERGGALIADLDALAARVDAAPELELGGLMAVAPQSAEPGDAFGALAEIAVRLRADYPDATMLSAGMSGDLEAAIAHGATHVRIGTALLGRRTGTVG
jgi:pyridoxal phosphate enzyme (YggS family)